MNPNHDRKRLGVTGRPNIHAEAIESTTIWRSTLCSGLGLNLINEIGDQSCFITVLIVTIAWGEDRASSLVARQQCARQMQQEQPEQQRRQRSGFVATAISPSLIPAGAPILCRGFGASNMVSPSKGSAYGTPKYWRIPSDDSPIMLCVPDGRFRLTGSHGDTCDDIRSRQQGRPRYAGALL